MTLLRIAALSLSLLLAGCGGGGESCSPIMSSVDGSAKQGPFVHAAELEAALSAGDEIVAVLAVSEAQEGELRVLDLQVNDVQAVRSWRRLQRGNSDVVVTYVVERPVNKATVSVGSFPYGQSTINSIDLTVIRCSR